jgi:hypothetical protein
MQRVGVDVLDFLDGRLKVAFFHTCMIDAELPSARYNVVNPAKASAQVWHWGGRAQAPGAAWAWSQMATKGALDVPLGGRRPPPGAGARFGSLRRRSRRRAVRGQRCGGGRAQALGAAWTPCSMIGAYISGRSKGGAERAGPAQFPAFWGVLKTDREEGSFQE